MPTTVNINAAGEILGVGGVPLVDAYDRIVATFWGPSTTDYGFCAVSVRCIDDLSDENTNGGLLVSHDAGYTATAGYGHTFQVYAATGMQSLVLGCNTTDAYIRFEVGPSWPDSEVGRIRGVSANAADWIFNWTENRSITASQSGTTVTASVGTFTSADVGRWCCWNDAASGKAESNAYQITAYTDSTHVTVDTSKTIASQPCRISEPKVHINSLGCVGINGPSIADDRFPMVLYGPHSSLSYVSFLLATERDLVGALGMYQYDAIYNIDEGLQGCVEIAANAGTRGLILSSYEDVGDVRVQIGGTYPTSEMLRIKRRANNSPDVYFGWNVVRTHTAAQSGTTVTASVGTFLSTDVGKYIMWAGIAGTTTDHQVYKITAFTSGTQVTVDTNMPGGIGSQSMRVCSPRAIIDSTGALTFTPAASATPATIGEMTFQATSNTAIAIKYMGSDGTVRTGTITLS